MKLEQKGMSDWERIEEGAGEVEAYERTYAWARVSLWCAPDGSWFLDSEALGLRAADLDAVGRQEAKAAAHRVVERRARDLFAAVEGATP